MIRLIRGFDRRNFACELDAFHKIRKNVFFDRFRWEVPVINSWEIDGYDALDPVYLLSVNEAGQVVGGLRLLPMTFMGVTAVPTPGLTIRPRSFGHSCGQTLT